MIQRIAEEAKLTDMDIKKEEELEQKVNVEIRKGTSCYNSTLSFKRDALILALYYYTALINKVLISILSSSLGFSYTKISGSFK